MTVTAIAQALGISRNSAHQQVIRLEAAGAIERSDAEPSGTVGKPAGLYQTVRGGEDHFSQAYKPLLDMLIQTLGDEMPVRERRRLFKRVGRAMAKSEGLAPSGKIASDLACAVHSVNQLGAMAELTCEASVNRVRCHSCPVATLVHADNLTCEMVGAFFAEATGRRVAVECQRGDTVVCGFRIVASDGAA